LVQPSSAIFYYHYKKTTHCRFALFSSTNQPDQMWINSLTLKFFISI